MHFANKPSTYFMLTAYHCFAQKFLGTQKFYTFNNNLNEGSSYDVAANDDSGSLFPTTNGNDSSHYIYTGGTALEGNAHQEEIPVVGSSPVKVGALLCQSGAFSGERCSIKVRYTDVRWGPICTVDDHCYYAFGGWAFKTSHAEAAGQGDSGGPVFVENSSGDALAVGIVSAGTRNHRIACVGITSPGRKCSTDMLFPFMTGTSTSIESMMNPRPNT
jgi:hypothetical protein